MRVRAHPSPNFGPRRGGAAVELIVLHFTAMESCEAARDRLCDPAAEVSAHYLIGRDGTILALVAEEMRAWHAGAGSWRGQGDVNSRSVGIEIDNTPDRPFSARQMDALEGLLGSVMARHAIPPGGVIGHSDMAPGRKSDPGPRFDWRRLALRGLSVWPCGAEERAARAADAGRADDTGRAADVGRADDAGRAADAGRFRADALAFGYPEVTDDLLLAAFRLRFRPWARGPLDPVDMAQAADLAARFGASQALHG